MLCDECGIEFLRLARHVTCHGMTFEEYIIKHKFMGNRPSCSCGCGAPVTFRKGTFKRFIRGHAAKDPVLRQQMIDAGSMAAANPEKRAKISNALIAKWRDDQSYRQRVHSQVNYERRVKALRISTTTPKFKEKMRQMKQALWSDEKWAMKQRVIFSSEKFSDAVSTATKAALSTTERHDAMSVAAKMAYAQGRKRPKSNWSNVKSGYRPDPFFPDKNVWFDSAWEHEFMVNCHSFGVSCLREPFIIPYVRQSGEVASYFPDFLVEDRVIVEIKGQETDDDAQKYEAGRRFALSKCLTYVVIKKPMFKEFIKGIVDERKKD